MIFVTVGTHTQPFDRLVMAMDELALELEEEIIIQYGTSTYLPRYAKGFQWVSGNEFDELLQRAHVIVGHTGSGTIIGTILRNKPLVLVPRQKRFHEHIDDHQNQLARVFKERGRAAIVYEVSKESLHKAITESYQLNLSTVPDTRLMVSLQQQLIVWRNEIDK